MELTSSSLVAVLCLFLLVSASALNLTPFAAPRTILPSSRTPLPASMALSLSLFLSSATPTAAFTTSSTTPEDVKIAKGYEEISGLLDNWVEATTNCKTSNDNPYKGNCDRTPIKVMEVLGYKSTTSPLFNAEKVSSGLETRSFSTIYPPLTNLSPSSRPC